MTKNILLTVLISVGSVIPFISNAQSEPEAPLSAAEIQDFKDQAQNTISALANYVELIGNKDKDINNRKKAVDLTVKLFMSDSNVVEVSSVNSSVIKRIPVRSYFMKLLWLPYEKVSITWYDVLLGKFELGKDGRYYATATVYQKFTGTSSVEFGGRKYVDITKKNIQIVVEKIPPAPGGIQSSWRLFLGDINVQETNN